MSNPTTVAPRRARCAAETALAAGEIEDSQSGEIGQQIKERLSNDEVADFYDGAVGDELDDPV